MSGTSLCPSLNLELGGNGRGIYYVDPIGTVMLAYCMHHIL